MKYNYIVENARLPKSRMGANGHQVSIPPPVLEDQTKTLISYMICTFNPYKSMITGRTMADALKAYSRTRMEAYQRDQFFYATMQEEFKLPIKGMLPTIKKEVKFFERWQEFNSADPELLI